MLRIKLLSFNTSSSIDSIHNEVNTVRSISLSTDITLQIIFLSKVMIIKHILHNLFLHLYTPLYIQNKSLARPNCVQWKTCPTSWIIYYHFPCISPYAYIYFNHCSFSYYTGNRKELDWRKFSFLFPECICIDTDYRQNCKTLNLFIIRTRINNIYT